MAAGNGEYYRVVFSRERGSELDYGAIVVTPSRDSWNDFGFQVRVDISVRLNPDFAGREDHIELSGLFCFLEPQERYQDTRALSQLLSQAQGARLAAADAPAFFTMLPDMAAYRSLVSRVGPDEAQKILQSLHEVVEAEDSGSGRAWLKAATDSLVFRQAFLRSTEAFFAWKNAAMLLRGVDFEEVGRISDELRIQFQLAGRPNAHSLQFRFSPHDPVLPKRFAVLIGKNGVGKSQTLGRIVDAAVKGLRNLTDGDGERPSFNRLLAFYPSAVASDLFPAERRRRSKVWYRRFSLGGSGYGRRRQTTADLVVQLARSAELIAGEDRFNIFRRAIESIEGHRELALRREGGIVRLDGLDRGSEQELLDRYAAIDTREEVVRVIEGHSYALSSGEIAFVRFAALASLYIENSSLLLFDEPETHLHPNFISQFVSLLDGLLKQTGSAAIIATHSVYFVREVFEDQVMVLRSAPDRSVEVEPPMLRTFGADVGLISYFVFGEDQPSRLATAVEQRIADESASWEQVFATYKDELSLDLLGTIRAEIEDRDTASDDA